MSGIRPQSQTNEGVELQNLLPWWQNLENIGEDWEGEPPKDGKPLHADQIKDCHSDLIRNVNFENLLGDGSFGEVWQVPFWHPLQ